MLIQIKTVAAGAAAPVTRSKATRTVFREFEIKAIDDAERTFTGMAAAFSQDLGGDIILPGAFKRTLADWKRSKRLMPLMDSHNYGSVRAVVGKMLAAAETSDGLEATFQIIDGPDGDEVFRRVKGGFVDGLSIGYRAIQEQAASEDEQTRGIWRFLKEIALREISVVVWPMNVDARVDLSTVKYLLDAAKDRTLSSDEVAELVSVELQIKALLDTVPVPMGPAATLPVTPAPAAPPEETPAAPVIPAPPVVSPAVEVPPVVEEPPLVVEAVVVPPADAPAVETPPAVERAEELAVAAEPVAPSVSALAIDDSHRLKMEAAVRELNLQVLSAR